MSTKLMDYFNKRPRLGTLSTASKDGRVDVAYFGSPRMVDENTVTMVLYKDRTLANLQENPHAVFMIMEPGKTFSEWKGVRVYLKMKECQTSGEKLNQFKAEIAREQGKAVAEKIFATVTFEVSEIRPFADTGQGWEKSI
jgi:hypothetical protein